MLVCLGVLGAFYLYRARDATPAELISYLPANNAVVAYMDVAAIRNAGLLDIIAGSKSAEELEYREFVEQTLFDYRQDLDTVAVAFKDDQIFFALRGRFHWKNLMDYAVRQGGSCHNGYCQVNGSRPLRKVSFYALKPNLMAMAVSEDAFAGYQIAKRASHLNVSPTTKSIWLVVPVESLKKAESLPAGLKPYVSALGTSDELTLAIGPEHDHLRVTASVTCHDPDAASALLADLQNTTDTLRKWLAREHQQPNPGDLSGVLTAGTFRREDRKVYGEWPVQRAFLESVAGGTN